MTTKEITVRNPNGLESRTIATFIKRASKYKSSIWVEMGERKANAKSLLGLLSLGIGNGSRINISADGEDEKAAVLDLEDYINSGRDGDNGA